MSAAPAELTLGLYEALLDGAGLLPALDGLARRVGASGHAVHFIRYRAGRPVGSVSAGRGGVAGAPLEEYARYWVRHDPWAKAGGALTPGVHDISRFVPRETLRRSRIWNEWGRPNDAAFHAIGVPLLRDGENLSGVFFHRREAEAPFAEADVALLEAVFPHLRRAFQAESQLAVMREGAAGALRAGLEALPDGVALFDTERRLVYANAALRRIAALGDGLALGAEGLTAPDPATRHALGRAVTAALAAVTGKLGLLPSAGTVAVPRPSGAAPWFIRALPMRQAQLAELSVGFQGAMLLVTDGEQRSRPGAALLAKLFGLTPAEAALAASVAAGRRLEEHAKRRGISLETARSQMAAIRRKTGCRRQADLAALLARLPGG